MIIFGLPQIKPTPRMPSRPTARPAPNRRLWLLLLIPAVFALSYGSALIGEPRAAWWWCSVLKVC